MNLQEALQYLNVSQTTMENMLTGGHFPSFHLTGSFSVEELEAFKSICADIRRKNLAGELSPPDCDEDFDPPVL